MILGFCSEFTRQNLLPYKNSDLRQKGSSVYTLSVFFTTEGNDKVLKIVTIMGNDLNSDSAVGALKVRVLKKY